jgi:hypothetical protein
LSFESNPGSFIFCWSFDSTASSGLSLVTGGAVEDEDDNEVDDDDGDDDDDDGEDEDEDEDDDEDAWESGTEESGAPRPSKKESKVLWAAAFATS